MDAERAPSAEMLATLPTWPLFAELPREVVRALALASELVDVAAGTRVIAAGEPADSLYLVVEGAVTVERGGDAERLVMAEGEVFGESCLLPHQARTADVVALRPLRALRLPRAALGELCQLWPRLGELMLELFTRRHRRAVCGAGAQPHLASRRGGGFGRRS